MLDCARAAQSRKNGIGSNLHSIQRLAGHADQIDTVSISLPVRQIVSEMSTINRHLLEVSESAMKVQNVLRHASHRFTVTKAAYILPNNLVVTEGGPSVRFAFGNEILEGSVLGCDEQRLARVRVIESYGLSLVGLLEESSGFPIPAAPKARS
jgi:hypothetical protein